MRRYLLTITLLVIVATVIGLTLAHSKAEPTYLNRPLSSWLEYNPRETEADRTLKYQAIEAMGTNAIPLVIDWLHAKEFPLERQIRPVLGLMNIRYRSASYYHEMAVFVCQVEDFSHVMLDPIMWEELSKHRIGGCGLMCVGEEQAYIASLLHGTQPQRESAARKLPRYSYCSNAISSLTLTLKDPSPRLRYFSARSLGEAEEHPSDSVPALIEALQDENEFVRMAAAYSLGKYGKDALIARPAIVPLLNDINADVRGCAKLALKQINAGKIGVQAKK
jgi:hypothetical protein